MTLETKKALLKAMILENDFYLDTAVYRLVSFECLDSIISRINDKSLLFGINIDNELNANDFISLLSKLIDVFRETFINLQSVEYIFEIIITSIMDLIEDYFFSYKDKDNSKLINEKICKIIISNFISNCKYISCIEELLKEKNLKLQSVNKYNLKDSLTILELLSDLVFCKKGRCDNIILFESIDKKLNSLKSRRSNKKYNYEHYKNDFLSKNEIKYNRILNAYNNKKKYLKFFK